MLVVFSGLPGTGKTTISKALVARRSAVYVRVDEIEHALKSSVSQNIGPAGYVVAFAVASSNLKLGNFVIADSVNPVKESRQGWRDVAQEAGVRLLEIEAVCSDEVEHKRRVETRTADIIGFTGPSWPSVRAHNYVPWTEPRLLLDTAFLSPENAVAQIEARISAMSEG